VRCKICDKKLSENEQALCNVCYEYCLWLNGGKQEGVDKMLEKHRKALACDDYHKNRRLKK